MLADAPLADTCVTRWATSGQPIDQRPFANELLFPTDHFSKGKDPSECPVPASTPALTQEALAKGAGRATRHGCPTKHGGWERFVLQILAYSYLLKTQLFNFLGNMGYMSVKD